MCFGRQPQAPTIVYKGPSDSDVRAQEQALENYRASIDQQNAQFQTQLQNQIDAGAAELESLQSSFDQENAAAEAAGLRESEEARKRGAAMAAQASATQNAAYTVETQMTEAEDAQVTEKIEPKKKKQNNLKISTAGTANKAGSGVNLGI